MISWGVTNKLFILKLKSRIYCTLGGPFVKLPEVGCFKNGQFSIFVFSFFSVQKSHKNDTQKIWAKKNVVLSPPPSGVDPLATDSLYGQKWTFTNMVMLYTVRSAILIRIKTQKKHMLKIYAYRKQEFFSFANLEDFYGQNAYFGGFAPISMYMWLFRVKYYIKTPKIIWDTILVIFLLI